MIEYRQYVPEDKRDDLEFVAHITVSVCEHLARLVDTDDNVTDEEYSAVRANVTHRESRNGGFWIHSWIEKEPSAAYLNPDFVAPFKVPVPFAKERDAVDFTPEELAEQQEWKARP